MRKYSGIIIDDQEVKGISNFVCFGEMSDGSKCFHEVDSEGNEIEGIWYSMAKKKFDGRMYTLFFVEGIE